MLATDPLSLVFLGCIIFSGAFLLISMVTGIGHGHLHVAHVSHVGHVGHVGHVAHTAGTAHQVTSGHAATNDAHATASAGGTGDVPSLWPPLHAALLGTLNPFSVLSFLFIFGLLGYILLNAAHSGVALAIIIPALLGLIAAALVGMGLARLFSYAEGELTVEATRPEGRIGKVTMAIRPDGVGEVVFSRANAGRQSIGATSATGQPIPADTEVVILALREGIASVEPWEEFMRELRAGRTPTMEAIEPGP